MWIRAILLKLADLSPNCALLRTSITDEHDLTPKSVHVAGFHLHRLHLGEDSAPLPRVGKLQVPPQLLHPCRIRRQ